MSLSEISEAEASGVTADFYAKVRADSGSAVVNFVWRHLATISGAAEWCWEISQSSDLEEISGSFAVSADAAAARLAALMPHHLSMDPVSRDIVTSYNHNNAVNACRIACVLKAIRDPKCLIYQDVTSRQLRDKIADADLPPLPSLNSHRASDLEVIRRLADAGPASGSGVLPSLWRHLTVATDQLIIIEDPVVKMLESADFRCEWSYLTGFVNDKVVPKGPPPPKHIDLMGTEVALHRFLGRICEMSVIGRVVASWDRPLNGSVA